MKRPAFCQGEKGRSAAVLLEVVLALALFAAAATIISTGLNASINSVERLRLNNHAANLAVTVLSQVQMGITPLGNEGPQLFEAPFDGWSYEVLTISENDVLGSSAGTPQNNVEVVIRHEDPPMVFRMSQILRVDSSGSSDTDLLFGDPLL